MNRQIMHKQTMRGIIFDLLKLIIILIIDHFCIALFCGVHKRTALDNECRFLLLFSFFIQTNKRFKRTPFIRTKTQSENFGGDQLCVCVCVCVGVCVCVCARAHARILFIFLSLLYSVFLLLKINSLLFMRFSL